MVSHRLWVPVGMFLSFMCRTNRESLFNPRKPPPSCGVRNAIVPQTSQRWKRQDSVTESLWGAGEKLKKPGAFWSPGGPGSGDAGETERFGGGDDAPSVGGRC